MPRPKKPGAPEPKRRSRNGCWPCKGRKVKCGEEHPTCINCQRTGDACDYSIRLNWEGRRVKRDSVGNESGGTVGGMGLMSSDASLGPPLPFAFINHTPPQPKAPARSNYWVEPPSASPTNTVPLLSNSPIQFVVPGESQTEVDRKKRGLDSSDNASPNFSQPPIATAAPISPSNTAGFMASPRPGEQMLRFPDATASGGSQPTQWPSGSSATAFSRPQKRTKSISESIDSEPFQRESAISSPTSMTAASPTFPPRFQSTPGIISLGSPLTPATPSSYSDDDPQPRLPALPRRPSHSSSNPTYVRLSVNSLLSGPPCPPGPGPVRSSVKEGNANPAVPIPLHHRVKHRTALRGPNTESHTCYPQHIYECGAEDMEGSHLYGYDLGRIDEDIGRNDDRNAISMTPPTPPAVADTDQDFNVKTESGDDTLTFDFRFGAQSPGGGDYYKNPVPIRIPYSLEPLPEKLIENKMNLLYFHHFLDHTARVLMPYDDQQSNPFRTILPQMAVRNDHLLSLLLAYSASHRARLVRQKEPEMRMALWVQDIFPFLRLSLNDSTQIVSNTSLATAIMLASLEIISPKAFGYTIPWQEHLNLARDLMRKRFSSVSTIRKMHSDPAGSEGEDQVCSFLWSWFAYLDVLGSFSGGPRTNKEWLMDYGVLDSTDDPDEIDCIMGFTTRCVKLLAETAELARRCDSERIVTPAKRIDPRWYPSEDIKARAHDLDRQLRESVACNSHPCKHIQADSVSGRDYDEMTATNEAFHWAGVVQIHRRILGKSSTHADVTGAVEKIMACLRKIRIGGQAEMGFLFPMFTAGCEVSPKGRQAVLERFRSIERNGMMQVRRARELMEKVWAEGHPWETLLNNEFIG